MMMTDERELQNAWREKLEQQLRKVALNATGEMFKYIQENIHGYIMPVAVDDAVDDAVRGLPMGWICKKACDAVIVFRGYDCSVAAWFTVRAVADDVVDAKFVVVDEQHLEIQLMMPDDIEVHNVAYSAMLKLLNDDALIMLREKYSINVEGW